MWDDMTLFAKAMFAADRAGTGVWREALLRLASRETAKALFEPIVTSYECWCCTMVNSIETTECSMCEAKNPEPKWR
jgi:hypothetical protein